MAKKKWMRLAALAIALVLSTTAALADTVYGSLPDDGVYVRQSDAHTCTLVSAAMMLRNYAHQNGYDYTKLTVDKVAEYCWSDYGLAQEFCIGSLNVHSDSGIQEASDRTAYLISQLKAHPEGIVIYNKRQPHAVFLFGYREETDIFFCADTTGANSLSVIPLTDTLLRGDTQAEKIAGLSKIWYIG